MRTLINYIRSCFCKHDWEEMSCSQIYSSDLGNREYPIGHKWTYRCRKCGCFKTYKDF